MTANYRQWISDATESVADAKPQPLPYWPDRPYKLFITAARPDRRRRDLDNIIKPINDLLKRTGLVADDHLCDSLHARWVTTGDGVAVRIEPAGVE
jgi:crossover junction endodeoxyribonuclease RusA